MEQLNGSLRALELKLDEVTNQKLNALFPGKKPAPEDYAW